MNTISLKHGKRGKAYADAARRRELTGLRRHRSTSAITRSISAPSGLDSWGHGAYSIRAEISGELKVAQQIGLEENEIGPTIASGLTKGVSQPRNLPFMPKHVTRAGEEEGFSALHQIATNLAELGENDADNAQRFVKRFGDQILWTAGRGWLVYAGGRWKRDTTNEVNRFAELTARAIADEVACLQREPERSSRARFATAPSPAPRFPICLNWPSPSLAPRTTRSTRIPGCSTRETAPSIYAPATVTAPRDLITRITRVSYRRSAKCPRFLQFLQTSFKGDEETIAFVHRVLGYTLTGITREQVFFLLLGDGENGKSTLMNLFRDLLGEYGVHTPTETLMVRQHDNMIPNDLARLVGKRMVTAAEQHWKRQLDEAKIKAMTGGEPITARFMRAEFFEFLPAFKLFIAAKIRLASGRPLRRFGGERS